MKRRSLRFINRHMREHTLSQDESGNFGPIAFPDRTKDGLIILKPYGGLLSRDIDCTKALSILSIMNLVNS